MVSVMLFFLFFILYNLCSQSSSLYIGGHKEGEGGRPKKQKKLTNIASLQEKSRNTVTIAHRKICDHRNTVNGDFIYRISASKKQRNTANPYVPLRYRTNRETMSAISVFTHFAHECIFALLVVNSRK